MRERVDSRRALVDRLYAKQGDAALGFGLQVGENVPGLAAGIGTVRYLRGEESSGELAFNLFGGAAIGKALHLATPLAIKGGKFLASASVVRFSRAADSVALNTKVVLQGVTDRAVAELAADPSLARGLMSPGSYNHLVEGTSLAPASYGKAVERLSARIIERDPALSSILEYKSKPFTSTPDFFGYEGYNLRPLDITTEASSASHLARPYGPATDLVTHPGLPSNLVFPR